jgi:hypothetical protein
MIILGVWSWVVFGHRTGYPIAIMHVCMRYSNSPANMGKKNSAVFHHFTLILHPKYSEKANFHWYHKASLFDPITN